MGLRDIAAKWFLGGLLKQAAEGKRGVMLQKVYWSLANKKTWTGVVLELVALWLEHVQHQPEAAGQIALVAHILVGVGLLDKAWRANTLKLLAKAKAWIVQWGTVITGASGLVLHVLHTYAPRYAFLGSAADTLEAVFGALAGAGLLAWANKGQGPVSPRRREADTLASTETPRPRP